MFQYFHSVSVVNTYLTGSIKLALLRLHTLWIIQISNKPSHHVWYLQDRIAILMESGFVSLRKHPLNLSTDVHSRWWIYNAFINPVWQPIHANMPLQNRVVSTSVLGRNKNIMSVIFILPIKLALYLRNSLRWNYRTSRDLSSIVPIYRWAWVEGKVNSESQNREQDKRTSVLSLKVLYKHLKISVNLCFPLYWHIEQGTKVWLPL